MALLATASLGAVWTSCAPDFGLRSVLDRLGQVEPTVLIAVDGYRWGGREHDRRDVVAQLREVMPSVRAVIVVQSLYPTDPLPDPQAISYAGLVARPLEPVFEQVEFSTPLWVLFSSGTTGRSNWCHQWGPAPGGGAGLCEVAARYIRGAPQADGVTSLAARPRAGWPGR